MGSVIDIILQAGRAAVELSLFVLLPVMIVMLAVMRLLEAYRVLDWLVQRLSPLLRPFGLPGLGVFAALQINLVSFAAPVATLSLMEQRGASARHLAATLAMVMAMAQANAAFPLAARGLQLGPTLLGSLLGGLLAAAITYHGFARHLSLDAPAAAQTPPPHGEADSAKGVLNVINRAGAEAFKIALGALPMLVLSLVAVTALTRLGAVETLTRLIGPGLSALGIPPVLILPSLTKYLAGGNAMFGVMDALRGQGVVSAGLLNASAGWLIHPLDLPGLAVLLSAGKRVATVWRPAVLGALVGIAARTVWHVWLMA